MMTGDDLKKIGEEVGRVIEENINPQLEEMRAQMVTKTYLDDKIADLEGSVVVRQRKEDEKVNRLTEILHEKTVLADSDVRSLREIQVFPVPPL